VKMGAGCPPTPVFSLGLRARGLVWRRGPTLKGHALLLRARRSEFRFPTEAPGHPRACRDGEARERVLAMMVPEEIEDEEYEQIAERVAAVDVAKASGMVCTRVPHPSRPGRRRTRVREVEAATGSIMELADHLAGERIGKVTLESTEVI
jgi:hypothetical protein